MSPAGRLESHQRGFWIEAPFQMQKTKALSWLFPECVRRVEKYNTIRQAYSYFGGTCSGNTRGKTWDLTRLAHQISATWPCHGWDSSRCLPAQKHMKIGMIHSICSLYLFKWLSSKDPACNAGDTGDAVSVPGSRRFPQGGNSNPLQYSCLGNPMDKGYSPWGHKELDVIEHSNWLLGKPHSLFYCFLNKKSISLIHL